MSDAVTGIEPSPNVSNPSPPLAVKPHHGVESEAPTASGGLSSSRKDKIRKWGRALAKAGIWFGLAFIITFYMRDRLPAHPIIVHTNSIDTGIYWLDLTKKTFKRGQFITFDFIPSTEELQSRYKPTRHTKMLWGLPGDVVFSDAQGKMTICRLQTFESVEAFEAASFNLTVENPLCREAGALREFDSQGRSLSPWLAPGKSYRLQQGEYWVYAPNPKSLDSRYNGPILYSQIRGIAKPVLIWGSYLD